MAATCYPAVVPAPPPPQTDQSAEALSPDLRILVADDNRTSSSIMGVLLRNLGLSAIFVEDGRKALHYYGFGTAPPTKPPFDVMIVDLMMPHMDGFATAEKVRWFEANARLNSPCYIIAISALDSSHVESRGDSLFNAFLQKPISVKVLRSALVEASRYSCCIGR